VGNHGKVRVSHNPEPLRGTTQQSKFMAIRRKNGRKKFLGYVIARGIASINCYNKDTQKWKQHPRMASLFESVNEAEAAIEELTKYKNTAEVRILSGYDEYLSVIAMSRKELDERRNNAL